MRTSHIVLAVSACAAAVLLGFVRPAPAWAADPMPSAPSPTAADTALLKLLDDDFASQGRADPVQASTRGDRRFDDLLPDVTPAGRAVQLAEYQSRLAAALAINVDQLSPANRTNHGLLTYELGRRVERHVFSEWHFEVNQMDGPQHSIPQIPDKVSFADRTSLERYLRRLCGVESYISAIIANLREGMAEGRTPPKIVMGAVAEQALSQGGAAFESSPGSHMLFKPFIGRDEDLVGEARTIIASSVAPAFQRLGEFLRDEYIPACRDTTACRDLPGGTAYYDFLLKGYTTLDLTAQQIHDIGLKEVQRIREEMMRTIARSDFSRKNELQGDELFRAFVEYLRTDPRFYFTEPDDLLNGYRAIAKRIDADMPRLFGLLPRLPYGVREMPSFIAPSSPTAYYYNGSLENGVPGYFIANTYRLDQRPKYEMVPLTLHEAVPGHHHQIAIALELRAAGLPEWRTTVGYTVFVEGWGLYAESLGLEMGDSPAPAGRGLYEDPYDDFGRHSYEMWRAMRLVVDTGIHALGWPRDRAIAYMLDNSALTRTNIEREVDRYIAWPGQAVAYKIGELHIKMLRRRAAQELGERFEIRGFHDAVLSQGAVPLAEMTRQVEAWMAQRRAR